MKTLLALLVALHVGASAAQAPSTFGTQDAILCAGAAGYTAPLDGNTNTLAVCSVPAGVLGLNGIVRITANWGITSSGNGKTLRVMFGGPNGTAVDDATYTASTSVFYEAMVINKGVQTSQVGYGNAIAGGTQLAGPTAPTIDTSQAFPITFTCQKASSGENCTLESYLVEIMPR